MAFGWTRAQSQHWCVCMWFVYCKKKISRYEVLFLDNSIEIDEDICWWLIGYWNTDSSSVAKTSHTLDFARLAVGCTPADVVSSWNGSHESNDKSKCSNLACMTCDSTLDLRHCPIQSLSCGCIVTPMSRVVDLGKKKQKNNSPSFSSYLLLFLQTLKHHYVIICTLNAVLFVVSI